MAAKWNAPPEPIQDLPICFFPGCHERAPYGYGVSLKTFGRHFCKAHRPDRPGAPRLECVVDQEPEPVAGDLFASNRRTS